MGRSRARIAGKLGWVGLCGWLAELSPLLGAVPPVPPPVAPPSVAAATSETIAPSPAPSIVHRLSYDLIIRLVYTNNPTVRAAREEMVAAGHGLDEFRANLSRLEPFVEVRSDINDFPNRRGAFGNTAEAVAGIKKETFEGAILSAEAGGAFSRFEFDKAAAGFPAVESDGGALLRTRLEFPFFGSRRRQDRIIAQAFQESTARKAQLDYLKSYNSVVDTALQYFVEAVYYQRLIDIYERYAADLSAVAQDPRVKAEDRFRLESVRGSAETTRNTYLTRRREDEEIVRSYLALPAHEDFLIAPPSNTASLFVDPAAPPDQAQQLMQRARENNPAFSVLGDARRTAELKRDRAIKGRYDVTTFLEGTTFPIGSPSYDDRFRGWTVGGGLNVRLNDRRVLKASQLKAEAEIRQFDAQIEAEELLLRRRISTETQSLAENESNRLQIEQVVRQKTQEFETRRLEFFAGRLNVDQLVETRSGLAGTESTLASNHYSSSTREVRLLLATGRAYELVGLRVSPGTTAEPR